MFTAGDVDQRNTVTAAQYAATPPGDDPAPCAAFDTTVTGPAQVLPPGKFRARAARERVHTETITDRCVTSLASLPVERTVPAVSAR